MADEEIETENAEAEKQEALQPLYQIYDGSKIAVSRHLGQMFKRRLDAAIIAYEHVTSIWEECFRYYNNDHTKTESSPKGVFKRGDGTENVIFSNLNIMLPAVYGRDPEITCSTIDNEDEPFCKTLQAVLNVLLRRKDKINAKQKIKKAAGIGLLTNFGVFKLNFTKKADSREFAASEMQRITTEMGKTSDPDQLESLYGQLDALERNMEVLEPSGFSMANVLPHNLIVDPYAEQDDGLDGTWMMERVFFPTAGLIARFTKPSPELEDDASAEERDQNRVYLYRPTHKAKFQQGAGGSRDDGLGMVMQAIDHPVDIPTSHTDEERLAYLNMYYTECFLVWDKMTRRVYLYHRDDWTWPLWVWDDPLNISRFFPYFIISYSMSTGGTVSVGETAYILDQQDELNDINKQKSKIRRALFDFFYYNSDAIDEEEAEKFVKALRGEISGGKHLLGVRAGEKKISEMIEAFLLPSAQYESLFDKSGILETINRTTNTSDALRGVQFKTNTNVASVQSYQESMRLSVGAKVDAVEDAVADAATAIAEIAVQNFDNQDVENLVGKTLAKDWELMTLEQFSANYSVELVAGSMEKPNSIFKKKEAIDVATAVGQFARGAPGATMMVMLRVLEKAFTEIVIKPEDWEMIRQEISAMMNKGVSTGGGQQQASGSQVSGQDIEAEARNLPDEVKAQIVSMQERGVAPRDILEFVVTEIQKAKGTTNGQGTEPV